MRREEESEKTRQEEKGREERKETKRKEEEKTRQREKKKTKILLNAYLNSKQLQIKINQNQIKRLFYYFYTTEEG